LQRAPRPKLLEDFGEYPPAFRRLKEGSGKAQRAPSGAWRGIEGDGGIVDGTMLGKLSANWRSASSTLGAAFTLPFLCFGLEEWKRASSVNRRRTRAVFFY